MKKLITGGAASLIAVGGLAFGVVPAQAATTDANVCTPSDAYTETIAHPAVGEQTITVANPAYVAPVEEVSHVVHHDAVGSETIVVDNPDYVPAVPPTDEVPAVGEPTVEVTVDNPDYVAPTYTPGYWQHVDAVYTPAVGDKTITVPNPDYVPATPGTPEVPEQSHIVHHDAEYVHHDAVTHTEYHFAKFTETRSGKKVHGDVQYGDWSAWTEWSPETHTSWQLTTDPLGQPEFHASWTEGYGKDKVYYERYWQARFDGQTKTVTDKDAWDEKVKDAWDEKVIDQAYVPAVPGTPAVGEPTKVIDNPDYIPASYVAAHDEWVPPVYTPPVGAPTIVVTQDNPDYVPAIPATPGSPAVGEPTITVANPEYVAAWDETVIDVQASDAIGEPTITIDNPAYIAAFDEIVDHAAVTCDVPAVVTPAKTTAKTRSLTVAQPKVEESAENTLAETGGDAALQIGLAVAGGGALAVGGLAIAASMGATRRSRRQNR